MINNGYNNFVNLHNSAYVSGNNFANGIELCSKI